MTTAHEPTAEPAQLAFPRPYLGCALIGDEELALVQDVLTRRAPFRHYGLGKPHLADDFEQEAGEYFDSPYVLAVTSGTAALHCAMVGLDLQPGDEIILPTYSWWSGYTVARMMGLIPVFAGIDRSMNLNPDDFARSVTTRTRAVLVVHFQGGPADLDRITAISREHNIAIIEDCAQAIGAKYHGRKVGSIADVGCFSLQQNKVITAGEGGLLTTADPLVYERAVRLHDAGSVRPTFARRLPDGPQLSQTYGTQYRMSELTAAVALAQLRKLDPQLIEPGRAGFHRLRAALSQRCPDIAFRPTADDTGDIGIALFMDVGRPERVTALHDGLKARGIPVGATSGVSNILPSDLVRDEPVGACRPAADSDRYHELNTSTDAITDAMACVPVLPGYTVAHENAIVDAIAELWPTLPT
jgi:dTDP-4-amino-4,6-dideoxygalactose transaminase